jgi:4-amino-4-deoxy-L-arabinose transferase-like glycosyltransferase
MLFFDLMAVFFFYKAMKNKNGTWWLLAGILLTFLASFSKGIQGLFPLATPVIYSLAYEHKLFNRKAWLFSLSTLIGIVAIYGILLISNEVQESYQMYFEQRFIDFPKTKHANTDNRLKLLYHLVIELAIPLLIAGSILLFSRINNLHKQKFHFTLQPSTLFFLLVGISASIPLMITFEQRGFYLNTSMPYYALALACISQSWLNNFQNKFKRYQDLNSILKLLLIASSLAGIVTTVIYAGRPKRDADKLHDIHLIAKDVGVDRNVCTTLEWEDWSMRYYFARYHQISITGIYPDCPIIIVKQTDTFQLPAGYHKSDLSTKQYLVYKN